MSENYQPANNVDPSLIQASPSSAEVSEKVEKSVGFFNEEFDLNLSSDGTLLTEPTAEQLSRLKEWHNETTTENGLIMPDIDSFAAKMVLAKALMPQINEAGEVQYLFGKGAGVELVLQGEVDGRDRKTEGIPYRTHSDFEIYGVPEAGYSAIEHSDRFRAVFGAQEIYPVSNTKGLHSLPEDLLHVTAESVNFGGMTFLVPNLELQFVDKFEKANEEVETMLRNRTDAEWLATAYELDTELIHTAIDDYVIAPEMAKLEPPEQMAIALESRIDRMLQQVKKRISSETGVEDPLELRGMVLRDFVVTTYSKNAGVANLDDLLVDSRLDMKEGINGMLVELEKTRQSKIASELSAKHSAVDAILQEAA